MKNDACLQKCCESYNNGQYTCMQFLRAVNHSIVHAQPLQIPDHSSDESDPADNDVADDVDTDHGTPSPADGVAAFDYYIVFTSLFTNIHCFTLLVLHIPVLFLWSFIFSPAFSGLAIWSPIFRSCIFSRPLSAIAEPLVLFGCCFLRHFDLNFVCLC